MGLFLTFAGIAAALFALEVGTRLLPPPYDPSVGKIFTCHPTLGWTGTPNYQGIIDDPKFQQAISFNSLGMHDTEHPLEKQPNTVRILMLGDSFIQAVQVSEAETAHQQLEDFLNADAAPEQSNIEVISGGVVNWGTNQQLAYYREQGRQFQPDLVLLAFYLGNDFSDNLPGNVVTAQGFNCYAPYFSVCDGQFQPDPLRYAPGISHADNNCTPLRRALISGFGRLFQRSRLYQQIEPLIVANQPRQMFGLNYPSSFSALYFPNSEAELEEAWAVTLSTIAQLRQEVEADGAHFGTILISPELIVQLSALSPNEQAVILNETPVLAQAQADRPNRRLAAFFNQQNIAFIDLTPSMVEHLSTHRVPLYIQGEGHWTAEGNRLAAEILARWLRNNSLLQTK
jgi:lysophospholipase L1-like esterase